MTKEFIHENFELIVEDDVLDFLVRKAQKRETGARGLASALSRHLEDVAFDAFGSEKDGRVSVHMDGDKVAVALSQ